VVPALDRGLLYGDGVFETIRAYRGVIFRLERHLDRLRRSMDGLELDWPFAPSGVLDVLTELLEINGLGATPDGTDPIDARIRITVTGGLSDGQIRLARTGHPTVIMSAGRLTPPSPEEYERGITLATTSFRQPWNSPLARIKTIHRLEYLMAREEARRRGADDGLILDDRGQVAEGTASNIALIRGSTLVTPTLEGPILPGVTREAVLEAAATAGFTVDERIVRPEELQAADEIFATSTSWEILAVRAIDGRPVGGGGRGPATLAIHDAFRRLVTFAIRPSPPVG